MPNEAYPVSLEKQTSNVDNWLSQLYEGQNIGDTLLIPGPIGSKNPDGHEVSEDDIVGYVNILVKDSKSWRDTCLNRRFKKYENPVLFWKWCRTLESGDHWEVWGRRNNEENADKHEITDNQIGDQIRVKKAHINSAWHEVSILPNIKNINEILIEERRKSRWGRLMRTSTHRQLTEGTAIIKEVYNEWCDIVDDVLCDNESIFPTPFSSSFDKMDGCTYVAHCTVKTAQIIAETYRGINVDEMTKMTDQKINDVLPQNSKLAISSFVKTKFIDHTELWLDDPTIEDAPFDEGEVIQEHADLAEGKPLAARKDQNHAAHMKAHNQAVRNAIVGSDVASNPDDKDFSNAYAEYLMEHINDHKALAEKAISEGIMVGRRKKYPYGRKIVVAGGKVCQDMPNELGFDWRLLFRRLPCEELPGQFWGRGIPEMLWESNHLVDTFLSRIGDISLAVGNPKMYFSLNDKTAIEKAGGNNNDPFEPGWFLTTPPIPRSAQVPKELFELVQLFSDNTERSGGVNATSYGETPGKNTSAKLMSILMSQNIVVVAGEAQQNLSDVVEDLIETKIKLMKHLYTKERPYFINGELEKIIVAELLDGIDDLQVSVKPNSNYPQQWETELAMAMEMASTPMADGSPLLPREAVLDILKVKFPQYAVGGKYYQLSQMLQLGMQKMKEQEAERIKQEKAQSMLENSLQRKGVQAVTGQGAMA